MEQIEPKEKAKEIIQKIIVLQNTNGKPVINFLSTKTIAEYMVTELDKQSVGNYWEKVLEEIKKF